VRKSEEENTAESSIVKANLHKREETDKKERVSTANSAKRRLKAGEPEWTRAVESRAGECSGRT